MKMGKNPSSVRALIGGAVCLAILGGMIVGHAWPLWTGRVVLMKAVPVDPRDLFRGEYVRLSTPANSLIVAQRPASSLSNGAGVPVVGQWWDNAEGERDRQMRGSLVYVQLAPAEGAEYNAGTISRTPVEGAVNLRGRIRSAAGGTMRVDYGLDAFYMQEGTARPVEDAIRANRNVQMEVAIAASGRARIRNLLIDGTPVKSR
jgi:uncharacterized membrane-anchored protein